MNKDKTTLFFSRYTPEDVQQEIKVLLGVSSIKHYDKYLGLPSFVGMQKKNHASIKLRSGFGPRCKSGRRGYYHKQGRKL